MFKLVKVEFVDEVANGGGMLVFVLDAAKFCSKIDCLCSHGGLYSLDSAVSVSNEGLFELEFAFNSFDDLFSLIELLLRIDALFGSSRLKLAFDSLNVVFDSFALDKVAVLGCCC